MEPATCYNYWWRFSSDGRYKIQISANSFHAHYCVSNCRLNEGGGCAIDHFFANIEITGSDAYFEENTIEEKRNAYNVVNASVGYRYDNWTFTLWAKNLFDEGYEDRVFFFDNYDGTGKRRFEAPAGPRNIGISANYRW